MLSSPFITSQAPNKLLNSDVLLSEQTPAFPATGLRLASTIRPAPFADDLYFTDST